MLRRVVTAAAVASGLVCPAYADMSSELGQGPRRELTGTAVERAPEVIRLVVGAPGAGARLDRVRLELRRAAAGPNATLTLVLSTRVRIAKDVITSIEVPRGARVTGLALAMAGQHSVATAMSPTTADDRYRAVVQGRRDPALLALRGWGESHDRLGLHVFPLVRGTPATVTIDMYLAEAARLELVAPVFAQHEVTVDGRLYGGGRVATPRMIDLPPGFGRPTDEAPTLRDELATRDSIIGPIELTLRDPSGDRLHVRDLTERHVNGGTSLFADGPPVVIPRVVIGCGFGHTSETFTLDKKMIRKVVRGALPRLRHCYLRAAQRSPTLHGSADLRFTIGTDGRIAEVSVDGTLASDGARACMAQEVQSWTFPASSQVTRVSYPITYQLSR